MLLTKVDLLAVLPDISIERIRENLSMVMPTPLMIPVSATRGEGIEEWMRWLGQIGHAHAEASHTGHSHTGHAHAGDHP